MLKVPSTEAFEVGDSIRSNLWSCMCSLLAVTQLLKILQPHVHETIPKDARTPKTVTIEASIMVVGIVSSHPLEKVNEIEEWKMMIPIITCI